MSVLSVLKNFLHLQTGDLSESDNSCSGSENDSKSNSSNSGSER